MPTAPRGEGRPIPIHRLTPAQMKEKRDKGLCFKCDSKWGPGHRCGGPKIFLIEETEEDNDILELTEELLKQRDLQGNEEGEIGISLHAITGSPSPKTMRVKVRVKNYEFVALIDTGSTHNFLHPKVARRVGLEITKHEPIGVHIADGSKLWSEGSCPEIKFLIQGGQFFTQAYILPIGGCDVVLGIQWLRGLGPILWDFKSLKMEIRQGDQKILIKGMGTESSEVDSSPTFLQELRRADSTSMGDRPNTDPDTTTDREPTH